MNDPWQILILDPNTATEKDVKAAYARLLKQHRPDVDPEGFRRVREAYEAAQSLVRERNARGTPPPGYSTEAAHNQEGEEGETTAEAPAFTPPTFSLPDSVQESHAEVERAAASGNAEQLEAALLGFQQQCDAAGVDGLTRAEALERACSGSVKLLAAAVPDKFLLRLVELGQVHLPHLILSAWGEEGRRGRIILLGRTLLEEMRAVTSPEAAVLVARVGVMVGLEKPALATSLGNLAYPHLPVDSRTQIMGQLEHEVAVGGAFQEVTVDLRPFWFERLRNSNEEHDWNSTYSLNAVDDLVRRNRYTWQGWGIVQQLLPEERWKQVENTLRNQAQQVAQSTPKGSSFPGWAIFPLVLIVMNIIRFAATYDSTPKYESRAPGYSPQQIDRWKVPGSAGENLSKRPLPGSDRPEPSSPSVLGQGVPGTGPQGDFSYLLPKPTVVPVTPPPTTAKPKPGTPESPEDAKARVEREARLRALQSGSLFDGSQPKRPPP